MSDEPTDLADELAELKAAAAEAEADTPADDDKPGVCPTCGQPPNAMLAAAASGNELDLLKAIRNKLSEAIETCPMRDLSPLTRRLQDVIKEIREIEERQAKEAGGTKKAGDSGGDSTSSQTWNPEDI